MSEVMMGVLQRQNESLTRQVEQLGSENEQVRKLLTEFDDRHAKDEAKYKRLLSATENLLDAVIMNKNPKNAIVEAQRACGHRGERE